MLREGAVGAAELACAYLGDDPVAFAACLLFYLNKDHCYAGGNKRTAWAAAHEVLASVKLTVEATQDELVEFVETVTSREESMAWFQRDGRIRGIERQSQTSE